MRKKASRRNNIYAKCLSNRMQNRVRENISLHFLKTNSLFPFMIIQVSISRILCTYRRHAILQYTFKMYYDMLNKYWSFIIGGCSSVFLSVSLLRWNETNLQFICPILFDSCYIRSFLSYTCTYICTSTILWFCLPSELLFGF